MTDSASQTGADQAAIAANIQAADAQAASAAGGATASRAAGHVASAANQMEEMAPPPPADPSHLSNEALDFARKMFDLARNGDTILLEYLKGGLPPNLTNNRGDTLLMLAAYHGHVALVKGMLTEVPRPADPNQLNGRGQSIVAGAVFKGYDDVVKALIEGGADPLAGQPNAEETAAMFNKLDGENGFKALFENASGRQRGAREAEPAVEDREQARRVPGVGLVSSNSISAAPNGAGAPR